MTANKEIIGVVITAVISVLLIEPVRDIALNLLIDFVQNMKFIVIGQMPVDSPYLSSMHWANSLLSLSPALFTIGGLVTFVAALKKYIQ